MRKILLGILCVAAAVAVLAGCASPGRGHGPVETFAFLASGNPQLPRGAVGAIDEGSEPKEVQVVVPPGTDMRALVATLSLNKEAVITVISTGKPVVQTNGVTANDFSVPVTYSLAVTGDKKPWTYRVTVREAQTNTRLSALSVPAGTSLSPGFSPTVHAYTLDVPFATTTVHIEARGQSAVLRSITIDGTESPGSSAAATVSFQNVQERTITVSTLAEDGATQEQYTVTVRRGAPDSNAFLSSLGLDKIQITPAFTSSVLAYQAVVPFETTQLLLKAKTQSAVATLTLGTPAAAGAVSSSGLSYRGDPAAAGAQIDFSRGDTLPVAIAVAAEDGTTQRYVVTVVRAAAERNALLSGLALFLDAQTEIALSPAFSASRIVYVSEVPFLTVRFIVKAAPQSRFATIAMEAQPLQANVKPAPLTVAGAPESKNGAVVEFPAAQQRLLFALVVTAQDGSVQRTTVDIRRAAPDANALLSGLSLSLDPQTEIALSPAFSAARIAYVTEMPFATARFTLKAAPQSKVASLGLEPLSLQANVKPAPLTVAGTPESKNGAVVEFPAAQQRLLFALVVTAQDGSVKRTTVDIRRAAPDANADLASLVFTAGALTPAFSSRTVSYTLALPASAENVKVTVAAASTFAAVTIDEQPGVKPAATQSLTLAVAAGESSVVTFVVTAQDGSQKLYRLKLSREAAPASLDGNALLQSLLVSGTDLTPAFDPSVIQYDAQVASSVQSVTVTAQAQSSLASVTIDGQAAGKAGRALALTAGATRAVLVDVTAQNGAVIRYTLRITRPAASGGGTTLDANAELARLTVDAYSLQPAFDPDVRSYDVKVAAEDASALVTAAAASAVATVAVDGAPAAKSGNAVGLAAGETRTVLVDVTAQNGAVLRYTLRLAREAAPVVVIPPLPRDSGPDHVVVAAKNLRLQSREISALATAKDQATGPARITVRYYRTAEVVTQYFAAADVKQQGSNVTVSLMARSNGVTLARDRMVEIETAIQTSGGKWLFYTEAKPADDEVQVDVPFLQYGDNPAVRWPAIGTRVPVTGYLSAIPLNREREADKEDFGKGVKGDYVLSIAFADSKTGADLGSTTVTVRPGQGRDRAIAFAKPVQLPEGATVKYSLSVKAKNDKTWSASGTTQVWTVKPLYPTGFQPAILSLEDDLAGEGG